MLWLYNRSTLAGSSFIQNFESINPSWVSFAEEAHIAIQYSFWKYTYIERFLFFFLAGKQLFHLSLPPSTFYSQFEDGLIFLTLDLVFVTDLYICVVRFNLIHILFLKFSVLFYSNDDLRDYVLIILFVFIQRIFKLFGWM